MLPDRITTRIAPQEDGCWIWKGRINYAGYGQTYWEGRAWYIHRAVWVDVNGPVPDGLDLDHLCRVRSCCNPAHLEPVTRAENVRRGKLHLVNGSKTACPQGHPYDEANTRYNKDGSRACRLCEGARALRYYYKKQRDKNPGWMPAIPVGQRTHCPQGHPYDEANTRRNKKGGRACRTCERERALAYFYRKRDLARGEGA